jgi:predicted TIM-barrel fold metal-dependent hydrolase
LVLAQTNSLQLTKPHTGGQRALYRHPARFHVVACGRRWGKTQFGKLIAAEAIFKHGVDVWWVSPTYKMSGAIWRDFRKSIGRYATWANASDRVMEFHNSATLTIWTGDAADTMRGGAPGLVLIDEAAMIKDAEMWPAVIRPALTDKRGRAMFLSTPRGHNWFWELYNRGNDPLFPDYKSWNFPSWYNPLLPKGEFEEARLTLPERFFQQEYGAEFIPDAGGVFRGVLDVSTADIRKPYKGRFVFGVDWGKVNDFTVISVFDTDTKTQVDIDRFNQISWSLQRQRLMLMYEKWKPVSILAEWNSIGDPNIEALQDDGLPVQPFHTNKQTKSPLIEALALAIERQDATLLNDRVQIAELQAYEMERLPGGAFRYNAPDGGHDDTVIATALGWWQIANNPTIERDYAPDILRNYRGR